MASYTVAGPVLGAIVLTALWPWWWPPLESADALPVLCFLTVAVVASAASWIPTHAVSFVSGMLFGVTIGPVAALLTIVAAALTSVRVFRPWLQQPFGELLRRHPRADAVHTALLERSGRSVIPLIALVRLSPLMPFAATNLLLAGSGVRVRDFLLGSGLGLAPRVILVAVAGAGASTLDLHRGTDLRLAIAGVVATVAALWLLARVGRSVWARQVEGVESG